MKVLGIDYGKRKIGIAFANGSLAEPVKVIHYSKEAELIKEIESIIERYGVKKVIVGVSEGKMAKESADFAEKIGAATFDETLTTQEAQRLSREAGIPQKKRKQMEDAYAATVMLQDYIDNLS